MRTLTLLTAGALAVGSFVGGGATALAHDTAVEQTPVDPATPPIAVAASTVTLPLLGAPLVIDVATDAGGGLVDVSLNQADDYTADKIKANGVRFVNDAGTTKVRVASHWGGQQVSAAATSLADISGPGGWSGDVFGDGQQTTVGFTVEATAEGGPDITGVTVTSAATFEVQPTEYRTGDWRGSNSQVATAVVRFEQNGERRSLEITAVVKTNADGTSSKVVLGLSGVRGRALAEGDAVGAHTWSGVLCDGTAASIQYTVNADGSISGTTATPEAQIAERGGSAWVAFSRREAVAITTTDRRHHGDDTDATADPVELAVGTSERIKCDRTEPTVNTEIAPDAVQDDGNRDQWGDRGDRGQWNGQRDGQWDGQRDGQWGNNDDAGRDADDRDGGNDRGDRGTRGDRGDDGGSDQWGGGRDGGRDGGRQG